MKRKLQFQNLKKRYRLYLVVEYYLVICLKIK